MRRLVVLLASFVCVAGFVPGMVASPAAAAPDRPDRLEVYVGQVPFAQVGEIVALGVDRHELRVSAGQQAAGEQGGKALVRVEAILSPAQARYLGGVVST